MICVISGVLMGLWNPFVAYGATRGNPLTPYSSVVFLTFGALLSCFVWNLYFMKRPLAGEPVNFGEFFRGPASGHLLGLFGGVVWGVGTVFNVVAGKSTSFAISYAIGLRYFRCYLPLIRLMKSGRKRSAFDARQTLALCFNSTTPSIS